MVARYGASPDVIRVRFEDLVRSPEATMLIEEALPDEMAALEYQRIDGRGRPLLDTAPLLS